MGAVLIVFGLLGAFVPSGRLEQRSLDLRAGAWVFPWLAGLTAVSYLGNYPEPAAGNLDALNFAVATGLVLLLSAGIYLMAYRLRLTPDQARAYIEESHEEASTEDAELTGR